MRMRKKKHGAERIAACAALLIEDPTRLYTDPQYAFPAPQRLELEIGCGKGQFACKTAAANPTINLIAMERVSDVACIALEKAMACAQERPDNLRFLIGDARHLTEWFPPHSVSTLYLNFSDPWPQNGYRKRRLTYRSFLELYKTLSTPDGVLMLKTDNPSLFDFSLEEFAETGLKVEWVTRDLHHSEYAQGNIMTEYEENFSAKGMPIYAARVRFYD